MDNKEIELEKLTNKELEENRREINIKLLIESKKHWMDDIVKPLKEGERIIRESDLVWEDGRQMVKCYDDSCPLCTIYLVNHSSYSPLCSNLCPLQKNNMKCCDNGSPWENFYYYPTYENAMLMVEAIEFCIEKEKEDN